MNAIPVTVEKKVYSVPEAAQVLGISASRMYELVRVDGFPVLRIGNRILVPKKGLDLWIDRQTGIFNDLEVNCNGKSLESK